MGFRKAQRRKAKLRLAITGTAGSGKTYSALQIAQGLGGKIAMIDTENGSGDLYAGICDYDILTLTNYDPRKYVQAIHDAEQAGYSTVIIDSLSHAWNGQGGILDLQGKLAEARYRGNSYAAWRDVTPMQNALVNTMLASPCHIIATMRSKTDYLQAENERGRTEIRKVGLAPVQREGMDYEFTTVFDLSQEHLAMASKDRTGLFGGTPFTVDVHTGEILREWLNAGADTQKGGEA
ncbi:MAG: AAA family ATPase [Synergistaceae bacterium]|nr:AAA family ATPase [Synergistaceae bacterium]